MNLKNVGPFIRFRLTKWKYLRRRLGSTITSNCELDHVDEGTLVMTVVAFNNVELLRYQRELLSLNLKDPHLYVVLDNSSEPGSRDEILRFCKEAGLTYIRCPENPFSSPSWSHAMVLEWFIKYFVVPKKVRYFGFIDHDMFPLRQTSILAFLRRQPVYGALAIPKEGSEVWYLWAGFCFFDFDRLPTKKLDFMPGNNRKTGYLETDSGGSNWGDLYSKLDRGSLALNERRRVRFRTVEDIVQSDYLDYHDDWVHTLNGSYWQPIKDREGKGAYVRELLEGLLTEARERTASGAR
ncbi:MAG: hypothetical protein LUQ16_06760 [Methanomassiliicoccales archaeon]|nr:hypothetical protein [Methanomassiliicoccales archaeon]